MPRGRYFILSRSANTSVLPMTAKPSITREKPAIPDHYLKQGGLQQPSTILASKVKSKPSNSLANDSSMRMGNLLSKCSSQGRPSSQRHRSNSLALPQLLLQIVEGHQGMTEGHSRGGVAHDLSDALLRLAPLAANVAVLAVSLVPARTRNGALERALYSGAALRAHAGFVFGRASMVAAAVNAADSLKSKPVFQCVSHAFSIEKKGN